MKRSVSGFQTTTPTVWKGPKDAAIQTKTKLQYSHQSGFMCLKTTQLC